MEYYPIYASSEEDEQKSKKQKQHERMVMLDCPKEVFAPWKLELSDEDERLLEKMSAKDRKRWKENRKYEVLKKERGEAASFPFDRISYVQNESQAEKAIDEIIGAAIWEPTPCVFGFDTEGPANWLQIHCKTEREDFCVVFQLNLIASLPQDEDEFSCPRCPACREVKLNKLRREKKKLDEANFAISGKKLILPRCFQRLFSEMGTNIVFTGIGVKADIQSVADRYDVRTKRSVQRLDTTDTSFIDLANAWEYAHFTRFSEPIDLQGVILSWLQKNLSTNLEPIGLERLFYLAADDSYLDKRKSHVINQHFCGMHYAPSKSLLTYGATDAYAATTIWNKLFVKALHYHQSWFVREMNEDRPRFVNHDIRDHAWNMTTKDVRKVSLKEKSNTMTTHEASVSASVPTSSETPEEPMAQNFRIILKEGIPSAMTTQEASVSASVPTSIEAPEEPKAKGIRNVQKEGVPSAMTTHEASVSASDPTSIETVVSQVFSDGATGLSRSSPIPSTSGVSCLLRDPPTQFDGIEISVNESDVSSADETQMESVDARPKTKSQTLAGPSSSKRRADQLSLPSAKRPAQGNLLRSIAQSLENSDRQAIRETLRQNSESLTEDQAEKFISILKYMKAITKSKSQVAEVMVSELNDQLQVENFFLLLTNSGAIAESPLVVANSINHTSVHPSLLLDVALQRRHNYATMLQFIKKMPDTKHFAKSLFDDICELEGKSESDIHSRLVVSPYFSEEYLGKFQLQLIFSKGNEHLMKLKNDLIHKFGLEQSQVKPLFARQLEKLERAFNQGRVEKADFIAMVKNVCEHDPSRLDQAAAEFAKYGEVVMALQITYPYVQIPQQAEQMPFNGPTCSNNANFHSRTGIVTFVDGSPDINALANEIQSSQTRFLFIEGHISEIGKDTTKKYDAFHIQGNRRTFILNRPNITNDSQLLRQLRRTLRKALHPTAAARDITIYGWQANRMFRELADFLDMNMKYFDLEEILDRLRKEKSAIRCNLDGMTEFVTGGSMCYRAFLFPAESRPSSVALEHLGMKLSSIYSFLRQARENGYHVKPHFIN